MNYVVYDLELTGWLPKSVMQEVMEIGAVKLDDNFNLIDSYQSFVRPLVQQVLSHGIKDFCHITQEQVDTAQGLPEVFDEFLAWCSNDFSFVTWGPDDSKRFYDSCMLNAIPREVAEVLRKGNNIQRNVTRILGGSKKQLMGVKTALTKLGLEFHGNAHRARDDAYNTSRIFAASMQLERINIQRSA